MGCWKIRMNKKFECLYNIYLDNFDKINGDPVCYSEFEDNEIPHYEEQYRVYLRETCLDDENFDITTTEDFNTWVETELSLKYDKEGNLI